MARARILALAALLVAPLRPLAVDAPHEAGAMCSNCHMGHNAPGGSITKEAGNANLCHSCHQSHPGKFGFPWDAAADQANPAAKTGISHSWSASATNPTYGAAPPTNTAMAARLDGGNLTCSACHDEHNNTAGARTGLQHTSYPVGVAQNRSSPIGPGTGQVTLLQPTAAAAAKAYQIVIVGSGSATAATFKLSNDGGTSFFGCSGPGNYVPFSANPCQAGTGISLNDSTNVRVTFTGTFTANDTWEFYVGYPFLRVANAGGEMCIECHKDRNQHWQDVEGGVANGVPGGLLSTVSLGTTVFSHPVGQPLAKTYDRTVGTNGPILDSDGSAQGSGAEQPSVNPSNDLLPSASGNVTCLSCHHPHNADSNSLSTDPR